MILSDGAHCWNATYYNDVRVPAEMLVGEANAGWHLITTQLNKEACDARSNGAFRHAPHSTSTHGRPSREATATPRADLPGGMSPWLGELKAHVGGSTNW